MRRLFSLRWQPSATRTTALILLTAFCLECGRSVAGPPPAWWSQRGALASGAAADDFAAVNQGQFKNAVAAAVAEMEATYAGAGGAGPALRGLVEGWRTTARAPTTSPR